MKDTTPTSVPSIWDYAIIVNSKDNIAVVKRDTQDGLTLRSEKGKNIVLSSAVAIGHRFATADIADGEFVRQYGQPIGTSLGIKKGELVSHANMTNDVPIVRDLLNNLENAAPDYLDLSEMQMFKGHRRPDGRIGTRNFVLIVPTSMCSSHEALQISMMAEFLLYKKENFPNVDGVVAIPHNKGCGCQVGSNLDIMLRTLSNYADHPNVGGVLLIDLGCEQTNLKKVEKYLLNREIEFNKPVARIGIQEVGGTQAAIESGLREVERMLPIVNESEREEFPVSELVLGVKCGSSDSFSGLSANPALGFAADQIVRSKGTVLITEIPEFCGAEHILANRAKDKETGKAIYQMIDWYKEYAAKFGGVLNNNPSPGNISAGLLNITIKSLGAMAKAGTTRVEGVCEYGEAPKSKGLHVMQGPGYDQVSTPGLVAAGATVVVFTTGNGTTIGNAITPVIKLASNNRVFEKMARDLDISAGNVIEGTESIEEVGERVFKLIIKVASGETLTNAELNKHREFQFWEEQTVTF